MIRRIFALVLMAVFSLQFHAADYMFKHLEVKDGLSNNKVNKIFKDSRGFMWFGTASGLNRYDGNEIKTYLSYDENGPLLNNFISDIQEDYLGRLWIGTNSGYSVYNAEKEEFTRELRGLMWEMGINGTPSVTYIDKNKNMWFYINGKGVYLFIPETNLLFPLLYETGGLPQGEVKGISECSDGILFVFNNGMLVCVDRETNKIKWQEKPLSKEGVYEMYSIYVDRDDDIWLYSPSGLWIYNVLGKKWKKELAAKAQGAKNDMVQSVYHARNGLVWVGRDQHGICVMDKETGESTILTRIENDERSLQNNSVLSLYEDANGVMWVGTYKKGVSYYSESIFKFGINHIGDVNCVEEDDDNHMWIGTNDEGLYRLNRKTRKLESFVHGGPNSISTNVIVTLKKTRDGKLWIGTFRGGLNCYDGNRFKCYKHEEGNPNSLSNDNIFAIDEDNEGNIWIGTLGGGIQKLNPKTGKFKTFTTAHGLGSDYISSLQVGKDKQLIVGTAYGLSIFDMESEKATNFLGVKSGAKDFSDLNLNQVYQDSRGLLWIATLEGLNIYDVRTDALTVLTEEDGLSNQLITGIVEDDNKNIWAATAKGLTNIIPSIDTKTGNYSFRFYTYSDMDGLQNCEFNMRTLKKFSTGELMVGGMYGVNYFHPDEIRYNKALPKVFFTHLSLFNEDVKIGKEYDENIILDKTLNAMEEVKLKYDQNVFSVEFASDNFILPEKMKFAYKLEGFNSDWLTTHDHKVTYTNLSSGNYTLKVKAINSDGYSGDEEANLRIVILPPFWQTTWAYIIYILLLVSVLLLTRYFMLRGERNKFKMQQIKQEADKNKEINEMKMNFFTNVSHELRTPLTLIISPIEMLMKERSGDEALMTKLQMMHRNASQLLNLVNQLLDFRKGDEKGHQLNMTEGDIVSFSNGICNSFLGMTEKKHVHLTFFSAVPSLNMSFDGDKYNKVLVNLLSNAFKFTPEGGRVDVSMNVKKSENGEDMLEIRVTDTGTGIKDEDKKRIFERFYQVATNGIDVTGSGVGLSLVSDFVHLHNGTIEVMDNVPTGSVFIVSIPVKRSQIARKESVSTTDNEDDFVVVKSQRKVEFEQTVEEPIEQEIQEYEPVKEEMVLQPEISKESKVELKTPIKSNHKPELPTALVVDDNEDFLNFMVESFSDNYCVKIAKDGREAWGMILELMPDVIISDVMMPEMDGNQLCKLVKSDKRTSSIPFILLTSCQSNEYRLEGLTVGADDYITKPFNIDILSLRIKKLIDLHSVAPQHTLIDPAPSQIEITSMDEKLIDHAVKYVEDNIARSDLSVEELSQALGMSRVHLYKKLVNITGKTPIEFIRVIRLKRAAQLLRQSQQNVSEVAYQVGFNNPKYFSKYFKEEFGVLPSNYMDDNGK